jgi:hypothetical protein
MKGDVHVTGLALEIIFIIILLLVLIVFAASALITVPTSVG